MAEREGVRGHASSPGRLNFAEPKRAAGRRLPARHIDSLLVDAQYVTRRRGACAYDGFRTPHFEGSAIPLGECARRRAERAEFARDGGRITRPVDDAVRA